MVVVGAGRGAGGGEVGSVAWLSGLGGGDGVGGDGGSLVGEDEASGFDFSGVLKGDLKGWERVFVAVLRRRRFEGWMGDIMEWVGRKELLGSVSWSEGIGIVDRSRKRNLR